MYKSRLGHVVCWFWIAYRYLVLRFSKALFGTVSYMLLRKKIGAHLCIFVLFLFYYAGSHY